MLSKGIVHLVHYSKNVGQHLSSTMHFLTLREAQWREYLRKMLMCCLVITTQKLNPAIHHLKYIYQTYLLKLYNFLLLYFLMNVRDILKKKKKYL